MWVCGCEGVGTVCRLVLCVGVGTVCRSVLCVGVRVWVLCVGGWVGVREGVWVCAPCILCLIFTLSCVLTKDKGGGGASYGSHATMLRY